MQLAFLSDLSLGDNERHISTSYSSYQSTLPNDIRNFKRKAAVASKRHLPSYCTHALCMHTLVQYQQVIGFHAVGSIIFMTLHLHATNRRPRPNVLKYTNRSQGLFAPSNAVTAQAYTRHLLVYYLRIAAYSKEGFRSLAPTALNVFPLLCLNKMGAPT